MSLMKHYAIGLLVKIELEFTCWIRSWRECLHSPSAAVATLLKSCYVTLLVGTLPLSRIIPCNCYPRRWSRLSFWRRCQSSMNSSSQMEVVATWGWVTLGIYSAEEQAISLVFEDPLRADWDLLSSAKAYGVASRQLVAAWFSYCNNIVIMYLNLCCMCYFR